MTTGMTVLVCIEGKVFTRARRGVRRRAGTRRDMEDPDHYKSTRFYEENNEIEDIYRAWDALVPAEELPMLETIVKALAKDVPRDGRQLERALLAHRKAFKASFRKASLLHVYHRLVGLGDIDTCEALQQLLVKKSSKSQSGVLVITVLTSPFPTVNGKTQKFSCQWNCYYCPNEPGQPRSYLHDEPAVKRANENRFDPVLQFTDRAATLAMNGHPVDKVELLVLGGTWASYPHAYQEEFVRDLFFAANTFWERTKRARLSLSEEQTINESERVKIIGLTLETRPDTIDAAELRRLRYYGCTRVQLGVQHTDDAILTRINRGHGRAHVATALARLKDACFKVDIHLMPQLPGASVAIDRAMFERVLSDPWLQADQWKIYPTQVVPWTVIKKWHEAGQYTTYPTHELFAMLVQVKVRVHPWIRLNRVVRDIPIQYVSGGLDVPNLREDVATYMAASGLRCRCIRCREIGAGVAKEGHVALIVRGYEASAADEYFLSFETTDASDKLLGFLRLRLPTTRARRRAAPAVAEHSVQMVTGELNRVGERLQPTVPSTEVATTRKDDVSTAMFVTTEPTGTRSVRGLLAATLQRPCADSVCLAARTWRLWWGMHAIGDEQEQQPFAELDGAALVRELHVYGQLIATDDKQHRASQHIGLGRRLLSEAERRARAHGCFRVAIIAGVGSRGYYCKQGYRLHPGSGGFMVKDLACFAPGWHTAAVQSLSQAMMAWLPPVAIAAVAVWLLATAVACVGQFAPPQTQGVGNEIAVCLATLLL